MFFDKWYDLLRVLIVGASAYGSLVLILRLAGKRSLAKLNIFDFVVTVAFGSTLATVLLSGDVALAEGVLAFAVLAVLQWLVAFGSIHIASFRRLIRAEPRLLLRDGSFIDDALKEERVTRDEVLSAIRQQGHGRVERIAAVVLETEGSLSVIAEPAADQCTVLRDVR